MSSTVWVMFIYYLIFKSSYGSRLCCKDTKPRVFQAVRRPLFCFRIGCSKSTSNQKLSKHFFCSINLRLIISADWQGRRMYHCAERLLRTCCLRWFAPKSLVAWLQIKTKIIYMYQKTEGICSNSKLRFDPEILNKVLLQVIFLEPKALAWSLWLLIL